jgi:hypothetical protein
VTAEPPPAREEDEDAKLDEELEETFPASDATSAWARREDDVESDDAP